MWVPGLAFNVLCKHFSLDTANCPIMQDATLFPWGFVVLKSEDPVWSESLHSTCHTEKMHPLGQPQSHGASHHSEEKHRRLLHLQLLPECTGSGIAKNGRGVCICFLPRCTGSLGERRAAFVLWEQMLYLGCGTGVIKGIPWSWKVISGKRHYRHQLKRQTSLHNVEWTNPFTLHSSKAGAVLC